MKKYIRIIIPVLIGIAVAQSLSAQKVIYVYESENRPRYLKIDWMQDYPQGPRYTVAFRPIYLAQNGLKIDFEFKLRRPGDWLQIGLAGHYRRQFEDKDRDRHYYREGWETFTSSYDIYEKLEGGGIGLAYKSMWSSNGWYYSIGASFNFYNVWYGDHKYVPYTEEGLTYYEQKYVADNTEFYKPEATFNIGKHFALGRRVFLDGYIGVGYAYSFYDDECRYFDGSPYAFGGRGVFFNAGFRIGCLLGR